LRADEKQDRGGEGAEGPQDDAADPPAPPALMIVDAAQSVGQERGGGLAGRDGLECGADLASLFEGGAAGGAVGAVARDASEGGGFEQVVQVSVHQVADVVVAGAAGR
jgi:hypothetical protein